MLKLSSLHPMVRDVALPFVLTLGSILGVVLLIMAIILFGIHIEHLEYKQHFDDGYSAGRGGVPSSENPFTYDKYKSAWLAGWGEGVHHGKNPRISPEPLDSKR